MANGKWHTSYTSSDSMRTHDCILHSQLWCAQCSHDRSADKTSDTRWKKNVVERLNTVKKHNKIDAPLGASLQIVLLHVFSFVTHSIGRRRNITVLCLRLYAQSAKYIYPLVSYSRRMAPCSHSLPSVQPLQSGERAAANATERIKLFFYSFA